MKAEEYESEIDPFLCKCKHCKIFWKETLDKAAAQGALDFSDQCAKSASSLTTNHNKLLKLGDRVLVSRKYSGSVRYVGFLDDDEINPPLYVGVKLDDNIGSVSNGIYNGKRYFHCPRGHGAMVPYSKVVLLKQPIRRPPVSGNKMFPSYQEVVQRRKERNALLDQKHRANSSNTSFRQKTPQIIPQASKAYQLRHLLFEQQKMHSYDSTKSAACPKRQLIYDSENNCSKPDSDMGLSEERQVLQLQKEFGVGEKTERMIQTLKQLHLAYNNGLELVQRQHGHG